MQVVDRLAERAAATFNAHVAPLPAAADPPPTLPAVESPDYANQAYYAVRLGMRRSWINRRNENFTFVDADTVRRRMSVDFTFPTSSTLNPGDMALVPLMLLTKQNLRNLDVRNGADEALALLTTAQNGTAATLGLKEILGRLVEGLPPGHPDKTVDEQALKDIVYAETPRANIAAAHLAAEDVDANIKAGALDRQLRHALKSNRSQIAGFIAELERYFMLLVPLQYWPGQRLVCKVSYDAAIRLQHASPGARAYSGANRLLSSLGLVGRVEFFDNLAVGLAQSYHAEAVPPRDTYIAEASLAVRRLGALTDDDPVIDDHAFRPHLRANATQRGDEGKLSLIIQAHREELVLPLAFSSLLISVVLGLLPTHVYELDGQTLGALLLVPFALSAFYIRSQENSYVTRMLRGVRFLAVLPLLAAVWAIGLVALGVVPPDAGARVPQRTLTELRTPFLVAAVPTAMLVFAAAGSLIGHVTRAWIRASQKRARDAARERIERAQAEGRDSPSGRARAVARGLTLALVCLLIVAALAYSGWCAASTWWEAALPTAPHTTMEKR